MRATSLNLGFVLALSYLALNREEESEGAFRLMLARASDHALDASQAPRVREFYDRVVSRWVRDGRPGVARATEAGRVERPVNIDRGQIIWQFHIDGMTKQTIAHPVKHGADQILCNRLQKLYPGVESVGPQPFERNRLG